MSATEDADRTMRERSDAARGVTAQPNPRRPKRGSYTPLAETLSLLTVSGNAINGLGETTTRQASPFFWHPPHQHPYEGLQTIARRNSRKCPGAAEVFMAAYTHPEVMPVAAAKNAAPAGGARRCGNGVCPRARGGRCRHCAHGSALRFCGVYHRRAVGDCARARARLRKAERGAF